MCTLKKYNCDDVSVMDENVKGVPDFWLTIFKNVEMLSEMIQVSCYAATITDG